MLKKPNVAGVEHLRLFVHEMGFRRACQAIRIHESTMRRWLRGECEPPLAAVQALYWLSSWGFSEACSEAHWSHAFLVSRVRQLEAALRFQPCETWRACNEAAFSPAVQLALAWPAVV